MDFSMYDSVLHVAGIAHRKETKKNKELYYKVNRDLTEQLAYKAKNEDVRQFIFLSTMSVYGLTTGIINEKTIPSPNSYYGDSKLQAEQKITELNSETFKVAILRPPMIYGKGCRGNYQSLRKLVLITPIFPNIRNKRSMIFIDNLSKFIKKIIRDKEANIFHPQNKKYVNTSILVKTIAKENDKKVWLISLFNPIIKLIKLNKFKKIFGDLIFENHSKKKVNEYNEFDFYESINLTEERTDNVE